MTNFILKFQTDISGVLDSHTAYIVADSVSEAESKGLTALKAAFPPVEVQVEATDEQPASTQSIEVKLNVLSVEQAPANTYIIA